MSNKLGIPNKGTSFCHNCFSFEEMKVEVKETIDYVEVTLTCGCGAKQHHGDPKNTFFEYAEDYQEGLLPASAGEKFAWKHFKDEQIQG